MYEVVHCTIICNGKKKDKEKRNNADCLPGEEFNAEQLLHEILSNH